MAALEDPDEVDFGSVNWDNEQSVEEFLKECMLEEDTPIEEAEAPPKRSRQEVARDKWSLVHKAVRSGFFFK